MIKLDKRGYKKVLYDVISSYDLRELIMEFSKNRVYFYSILKDISLAHDSPNFKIIEEVMKEKKVSVKYIVEQASSMLTFLAQNQPEQDYYKTLNVDYAASLGEIRESWLNLIKMHHPDKAGEPGLDSSMKLNEAYNVLADPVKRARYDAALIPQLPIVVRKARYFRVPRSLSVLGSICIIIAAVLLYIANSKSDGGSSLVRAAKSDAGFPSEVSPSSSEAPGDKRGAYQEAARLEGIKKPLRSEKSAAPIAGALPESGTRAESNELQVSSKKSANRSLIPSGQGRAEQESAVVKEERMSPESPLPVERGHRLHHAVSAATEVENRGDATGDNKEAYKAQLSPVEHKGYYEGRYEGYYEVRKGDSLWLIARRFGTTIRTLKGLNGIRGDKIRPGEVLILSATSERSHVVAMRSVENQSDKNTPSPAVRDDESAAQSRTVAENKARADVAVSQDASAHEEVDGEEESVNSPEQGGEPSLGAIKQGSIATLNAGEMSLFSFVSEYISAYKSRDMNKFISLFEPDATENGNEISNTYASYEKNFSSLKIKRYDLTISALGIHDNMAYVDGNFLVTYVSLEDGSEKNSRGAITWRLSRDGESWKIKELNYRITDEGVDDGRIKLSF